MKGEINGAPAILDLAAWIADDVLFPAAMATDRADRVPAAHLDLLAARVLYGLAGPADQGGLDADPGTANRVIETLAGGCLATAFVWLQHQGAARDPGRRGGRAPREVARAALSRRAQ